MKNLKPGDLVTVQIEKMSLHGGGLARHEGFVIFVEYAAPGDVLEVELLELKKNHGFASIRKILTASPERRDPPCPSFGDCGGCNWQHLNEDSQRQWKQSLVAETLSRTWKGSIDFLPLVHSPQNLRYRNRIQLKKDGSKVGYFAARSHRLVTIHDCLLAEEALRPAIAELREKKQTKIPLENWEVSLDLNLKPMIRSLDQRDLAFSQVNRGVNELLIAAVLKMVSESEHRKLWDLYCGSGNFTFPVLAAHRSFSAVGVELSNESIQKAQGRATELGYSPKTAEFYCMDVGQFLKRQTPTSNTIVLLDPPRSGLHESVVKAIGESPCTHVIYISCDPMSLSRDLARLQVASANPWKTIRVQCFDMFPQTDHVETLVELKR